GLAGVDAVAEGLGAWFEPEFLGETPPPPGSRDPDFTSYYVVHLPRGIALDQAQARFSQAREVSAAKPIAILYTDLVPNDSLCSASWWYPRVRAPEAWNLTTGDTSIVVAILDSGILSSHPDLGGTTPGETGQMWVNRAEADGVPGVDDDHNGFVDDV